jgi:hypothetical protein
MLILPLKWNILSCVEWSDIVNNEQIDRQHSSIALSDQLEPQFHDFKPRSAALKKLIELRAQYKAKGGKFKTAAELQRELDAGRQ